MHSHLEKTPPDPVVEAASALPIAPPELLAERLLNRRFDRKFLAPLDVIPELLAHVAPTHAVLRAGERVLARYSTIYLDSPDRRAFHDHRRGRPRRAKVRVRDYLDRDLVMLEIKQRQGNGHTLKLRRERETGELPLSTHEQAWVASEVPWGACVQPVLTTEFLRVGLVGIDHVERVTIDVALQFAHGDVRHDLGPVAIIEVKTPRWRQPGPVVDFLHACGPRAQAFSKYCVGSILVEDSLPYAIFRPVLRSVQQVARPGDLHA